jgi:GGDEF domain-containing protein
VLTCIAMAVLVMAFTWFAMRIIIRPFYKEQEEANLRLEMKNQELLESRKKLEKAGSSMAKLYDLSIAMQYSGFLESHLPLVLGVLQERFDVDRILLMMPDDDGATLRCSASVGNVFEPEDRIFVPVSPQGGAMARAYLTRKSVVVDGPGPVPADLRLASPQDRIRSLRSRSYAVIPLVSKDKVIGVLGIDNKMSRRPLAHADIESIEGFAFKMASLIENTVHVQGIRKAAQEMESRDRLTGLFHMQHAKTLAEDFIAAVLRDKVPLSAALFHISNFADYLGQNGYERADYVLRKTAEVFRGQEVMGVVPVRCYGATFMALFPGKNREQGQYLADRFLGEIGQFAFFGEKKLAEGRLVFNCVVAEYVRESGQSFNDFFDGLETVRAGGQE